MASYPADSTGIVRSVNELEYRPKLFGGAMIGLSFAAVKAQFGPALNGIVTNDNYVPEPTMKFPGVDDFLQRYQERAPRAGVDALGYFLAPFAYAAMQLLGAAVTATGDLDQEKIAAHLHQARFSTIVGDVKFGSLGEWENPDPDDPISAHQRQRHCAVQATGQAGDPLPARTEIGRSDRAFRQSA